MKILVQNIDPFLVGALRTVLAAVPVVPLLILYRPPLPTGWVDWVFLLAGSLGNYIAFPIFASLGLTVTTAAHASLIFASAPALTAFLGAAVMEDPISSRRGLGMGVALAGVMLLIGPQLLRETARSDWRGDLLITTATLGSSISYVAGAYLGRRMPAWTVISYSLVVAATPLVPSLVTMWRRQLWAMTPTSWIGIFYLSFLGTLLANILGIWALSRGSVVAIGATQFLQPALTVAMAAIFLGERLAWAALIAGLIILSGVRLLQVPSVDPRILHEHATDSG